MPARSCPPVLRARSLRRPAASARLHLDLPHPPPALPSSPPGMPCRACDADQMNAELSEPVLAAVASQWQQLFGQSMSARLAQTQAALSALVGTFDARFRAAFAALGGCGSGGKGEAAEGAEAAGASATRSAALVEAGVGSAGVAAAACGSSSGSGAGGSGSSLARAPALPSPLGGIGSASSDGVMRAVATRMRAAGEQLKADANKQQQEISRAIEPAIQAAMGLGYSRGAAEGGTGSHARRMDIIDGHVRVVAASEFKSAADSLTGKLVDLQKRLIGSLSKDSCEAILVDLRMSYCSLWDDLTPATLAARQRLQGPVAECLLEAQNSLRALTKRDSAKRRRAESAAAGGGDDDMQGGSQGDELVDVTEQMQAKKAKERAETTIDLDEGEWANAQAPPGPIATEGDADGSGCGGPVRVKPEKVASA